MGSGVNGPAIDTARNAPDIGAFLFMARACGEVPA